MKMFFKTKYRKQLNLSNENLNVHENCPCSIQISSTNRRWHKFLLKTGMYFVKAIIRWKLFFFQICLETSVMLFYCLQHFSPGFATKKANPSTSRKPNICHNFYQYKFQIVFCSQMMPFVEQNILKQFLDSYISRNCNTCLRSTETLLCQKCLQLPKILFLLLVENSALSWPN